MMCGAYTQETGRGKKRQVAKERSLVGEPHRRMLHCSKPRLAKQIYMVFLVTHL